MPLEKPRHDLRVCAFKQGPHSQSLLGQHIGNVQVEGYCIEASEENESA
jgi:hypothetical protein